MLARLPERKRFNVVGVGAASVELVARVERLPAAGERLAAEAFRRQVGGPTATALAACARLGLTARYYGKVGDDEPGTFAWRSLQDVGVEVSETKILEGVPTEQALVLIEAGTDERAVIQARDPRLFLTRADYIQEEICVGQVLLLDGQEELQFQLQASRWAHEDGMPVVLDGRRVLKGADKLLEWVELAICSPAFAREVTGEADLERALAALVRGRTVLAAATLGAEGSVAVQEGRVLRTPAYRVATEGGGSAGGEGSVFRGAFVCGLVRGWDAVRALEFANACAALSRRGPDLAWPTETEALALIGARGGP